MTSRPATRGANAEAGPPRRSGPPVGLLALGALVVVVLVGVVVAQAGGGGDDGASADGGRLAAYGEVRVTGDALPAFDAGQAPDPAVGRVAPTLRGIAPDGTAEELPARQPTIVAFVAHWCPHCQAEVPRIVQAAKAGELEGVRLVAVATGTNPDAPNYPPGPWLEREGWPGRVLLDDQQYTAADAFGLAGYPFLVALDGQGRVVARTSGELPPGGLEQLVAQAKAGAG